jgi:hypothetical protein
VCAERCEARGGYEEGVLRRYSEGMQGDPFVADLYA